MMVSVAVGRRAKSICHVEPRVAAKAAVAMAVAMAVAVAVAVVAKLVGILAMIRMGKMTSGQ